MENIDKNAINGGGTPIAGWFINVYNGKSYEHR